MLDLHARRRDTIMAAYEAGVAIYAGTDAGGVLPHGGIAERGARARGLRHAAPSTPSAPRRWRAREWLGWNATLAEGAPADFVVYDRDPLEDLVGAARARRGSCCAARSWPEPGRHARLAGRDRPDFRRDGDLAE